MTANQLQEQRLQAEFKSRISQDQKTVRCPSCDQLHGLWYRMAAADKKTLVYTCNRQKHYWWTREPDGQGGEVAVEHWKHVTKTFQAPVFIDGLPLFVDWSPAKRKEYRKRNQLQMPLMIKKHDHP